MTPPLEWHDWMSTSFYRIRVAAKALDKIRSLPDSTQERLRQMLSEIADVADVTPPSAAGRGWNKDPRGRLLSLGVGRVDVHYIIDEENRILSVEHVVSPKSEEAPRQRGSEGGQAEG